MRCLLDTNAVGALVRDNAGIWMRLRAHRRVDIGISAIVAHELYYGTYRGNRRDRALALIEAFRFPVLDFTVDDARRAGEIRAALAADGTPTGPYDVLIAGQAHARDLTLDPKPPRIRPRVGPARRGLGGGARISRPVCPGGA